MRTAAAVRFIVACAAGLAGVWLIWREAGSLRRVLMKWEAGSDPLKFGHQASAQVLMMGTVVRALINARYGSASQSPCWSSASARGRSATS